MPYVDGAFTGSLFGDTWKQVEAEEYQNALAEGEWEEVDEEVYVTLDLGPADPLIIAGSAEYQLIGLDTPTPYLKIGNSVFIGHPTELIGDEIIFRDTRDPENPIKHSHPAIATTRSLRITFTPVALQPHPAPRQAPQPVYEELREIPEELQYQPQKAGDDPFQAPMPLEIPADGKIHSLLGQKVKKKPRGRPFPKKVVDPPVVAPGGDVDMDNPNAAAGPSNPDVPSLSALSINPLVGSAPPKKKGGRPKGSKDVRPRLPRGARALLAEGDMGPLALADGSFVWSDGRKEREDGGVIPGERPGEEVKKRKKRVRRIVPGLFGEAFPVPIKRPAAEKSGSPGPSGSGSGVPNVGRPKGAKNKPKPLAPPGMFEGDFDFETVQGMPEIDNDFIQRELSRFGGAAGGEPEEEDGEDDEDEEEDEDEDAGPEIDETGLERMEDSD